MDKIEITNKINKTHWYHSFELLPGIFTPGHTPCNPKRVFDKKYKISGNLSGLKALDIGTWDGPYAFELERRGADVIGFDIQHPDHTSFNTAKEIINSNVQYIQGSVYDLSRIFSIKFDIILFLGVYYHLKSPILAFEQIHKILKDDGLLLIEGECLRTWAPVPAEATKTLNRKNQETENVAGSALPFTKILLKAKKLANRLAGPKSSKFARTIADSEVPLTLFYSGQYKQDPSTWFIPNFACMREWLTEAGLELVSYGFHEYPDQRFWGKAKKVQGWEIPEEHGLVKKDLG